MGTENPQELTSGPGDDQPQPSPTPTPTNPAPPAAAPAPAKRGGLAGIIDEFRDAIAGTKGPATITRDSEGMAHVDHPSLSHGQQWAKIASEALRGAGAAMETGTGPGQKARALGAGIKSADEQADKSKKQNQEMTAEARQENLDHFNMVKLKQDNAAAEFTLKRAQVLATQQDIQFAQSQLDREKQLGSADLGVFKDEADLARVREQRPDFWKHVHDNEIVQVPELDANGKRIGIHLFHRAPGVGSQLVPAGTPIKIYQPGKTPNDPPTLVDQVPTIPMSQDQVDQLNNAATSKYNDWQKNKVEMDLKKEQTANLQTEEKKNKAEANKANAEADALRAKAVQDKADDASVDAIIQGQLPLERLSFLMSKPEGRALVDKVVTKAAEMGVPFDGSRMQSFPKLYIDYSSGKVSQSMTNMGTALQAIEDLTKLNTYSSRIPGSDAKHAFESKLADVAPEIANGLAKPGVSATKDEIHTITNKLSTFLNRDSAMRQQIHSMIEQYTSMRNKWQEGAPSPIYEAKMPDLPHEAKDIIRKYAPDQAQEWWGRPYVVNGKLLGYTKDGKTFSDTVGGTK